MAKKQVEKEAKAKKSPADIVRGIFTSVILLAAMAMMVFTVVSVTTFDQNEREFFGYKMFIVRSDSMSATDFGAGDLIFVQDIDPTLLKEGDIITFRSKDSDNFGELITHKIRAVATDSQGYPSFITYGTTTDTDDSTPVDYNSVVGIYRFALPKVGTFFNFLKTVPGYICCILMPFLILIIMQGLNSVKLFRQYKAEQEEEFQQKRQKELDELAAEREKLKKEREQSERLLEELRELRAKQTESTDDIKQN